MVIPSGEYRAIPSGGVEGAIPNSGVGGFNPSGEYEAVLSSEDGARACYNSECENNYIPSESGAIPKKMAAKPSKQKRDDKERELERMIGEERNNLATHMQSVENLIDSKGGEMTKIIVKIDHMKDEKRKKSKGLDQVDKELSDLKTRMQELSLKRKDLLEEMKQDNERIQKWESKRSKLEAYIDNEVIAKRKKGFEIEENIQSLEKKLSQIKKDENGAASTAEVPETKPKEMAERKEPSLLEYLDSQIDEKERELECPVCLLEAEPLIFTCPEQHLICSNCRPKVKACPLCKLKYDKSRRHRYAEKTSEELAGIRKRRERFLGS